MQQLPVNSQLHQKCWELLGACWQCCANGRNNSQLLHQKCWELLGACWQCCANGCNNSQQCWDLQCIVGRIQSIFLCKPCVVSVRGPNNVGRAVQTDPTLLGYASEITEQKKCWELLAEKFDRFQTLRNNKQQHPTTCNRVCKRTQHVTSNNVGSCCTTMLRPFARSLTRRLLPIAIAVFFIYPFVWKTNFNQETFIVVITAFIRLIILLVLHSKTPTQRLPRRMFCMPL